MKKNHQTETLLLGLQLVKSMALDKLFNLSDPQFPYFSEGCIFLVHCLLLSLLARQYGIVNTSKYTE